MKKRIANAADRWSVELPPSSFLGVVACRDEAGGCASRALGILKRHLHCDHDTHREDQE